MESHDETGCKAPEGPILCVNNCGFFGSAATMNMCLKCHKATILKQEQVQLEVSQGDDPEEGTIVAAALDVQSGNAYSTIVSAELTVDPSGMTSSGMKPKEGPSRCTQCCKCVGLTGFNCKCGNVFCAAHCSTDKHECPFNYRAAGRDSIAKANPVVEAEKLDKI